MTTRTSRRTLLALLAGEALSACASRRAPPRARADAGSAVAAIDTYLRRTYPADEPGAAILVARAGRVIVRAAHGLADIETRQPLTPESVFHIASITKNFTAAAVLRLVEQGVMSLDDRATDRLPGLPDSWREIRLRHLLTHTAGIVEFTDLLASDTEDVPHETLFRWICERPPVRAPGEDWAYNNSGYLVLGRILERHGGRPWGELMQRQFHAPLGMRDTVYAGRPHPRLVPGHQQSGGRIRRVATPATIPHAAGATLSTVDDLARWIAALEAGEVLREATRAETMTRVQLNDGTTGSYGMGWAISAFAPQDVTWHGGGIAGYSSMLLYMPDRELVVVVLSNHEHAREPAMFVATHLAELALGEDWSPSAIVDARALTELAGEYRTGRGDAHVMEVRDGRLCVRLPGSPEPTPLAARSQTEFLGGMGLVFRFVRAGEGPATGVLLRPWMGKEERMTRVP